MKALVTGSAGFVGRHFVPALLNAGYDVHGVDLKSDQAKHPLTTMYESRDVREFFRNALPEPYDLVIHLAAVVGGREMIEGQPLKVATDLAIDADFFQWVLRTKPTKVVYFSSSAAYPIHLQRKQATPVILSEDSIRPGDMQTPDQTYGLAKLVGEYQARLVAVELAAKDVDVYIFRPFSGYGTDQDLNYPFPAFIERAKRHADPFEIWGDGEQVRDFIHIDDIVEAVLSTLRGGYYVGNPPMNLCSGVGTSFNQLANLVCTMAGYEPKFKHLDKPEGVFHRVGSTERMNRIWTPKVSLRQGIYRALHGDEAVAA